ncbi:hypothetical protein [Bacillus sp. SRB1LM]|uniref:hypothetical protein n=1 Tax=Bacillus sp. SRB1LM TaxID=2608688 RepID=UPI0035A95CFE
MFLNIKEMSRALCFDNSVTNNNLFGRQASFFVIGFSNDIEAQRCITCNCPMGFSIPKEKAPR